MVAASPILILLRRARRDLRRATRALDHDDLTGLASRQAWDRALRSEEDRARRYGGQVAVVALDLERPERAADDELVQLAARTVVSATRNHDLVARLGGAELGVLAVECDAGALDALVRRLEEQLAAAGVPAAIGAAVRPPEGTLEQAWLQADSALASGAGRSVTV
jgi:diguanylate cyclase (GGDEF)-like protein